MEAVTGYEKRDLDRAVRRLTIFPSRVRSESHDFSTQKKEPPCAVDDSNGHGASDGPRGSSPAINEVRCECSSGGIKSDLGLHRRSKVVLTDLLRAEGEVGGQTPDPSIFHRR
ncbi:hypothetical protein ARALYDRAFT_315648 [Arabidopsis lyrata subsp. lyrata]|uniref:Uncharacterized protein n=1 Tax=Arabidopsis lyrata subsp. lyrata TaxID=81972 RepID=D7KTL1_ARALL|nr:hypothetical protein ARALYDRAFT_315648 [Arabidopsis lyrata subsp. lyrata]